MPVSLTPRERAQLKARAHSLEPTLFLGQAGVSPAVLAEARRALAARELIKVRIECDDRRQRAALGVELAAQADAALVHSVGKIVVLWRPRSAPPEPPPAT